MIKIILPAKIWWFIALSITLPLWSLALFFYVYEFNKALQYLPEELKPAVGVMPSWGRLPTAGFKSYSVLIKPKKINFSKLNNLEKIRCFSNDEYESMKYPLMIKRLMREYGQEAKVTSKALSEGRLFCVINRMGEKINTLDSRENNLKRHFIFILHDRYVVFVGRS